MLKPTQDKEAMLSDEEIRVIRNPMNSPKNKVVFGLHDVCRLIARSQLARLERLGYHKD